MCYLWGLLILLTYWHNDDGVRQNIQLWHIVYFTWLSAMFLQLNSTVVLLIWITPEVNGTHQKLPAKYISQLFYVTNTWVMSLPMPYVALSYSTVVLYIRDYAGGLGFSVQQYHPKTSLTILIQQFVRHSQAQKCFQINPIIFQEVVMKFLKNSI